MIPLSRPLVARDGTELNTIADGAAFISKLPEAVANLIHWQLARQAIDKASQHGTGDLVRMATEAVANAIATDA
jgi:hypothetical protein